MMLIAFDALRAHEPYDFSDRRLMTRMQARGMALAGDGFVPPPLPVSFLFVQRKLGGVSARGTTDADLSRRR